LLNSLKNSLANSTGIIDAGYRGHIMGMFDVVGSKDDELIDCDFMGDVYDRYVQICAHGVSIDNSFNSSLYYKRVNNENLYFYNENDKYDWDSSTTQLYKDFLNNQNISVSDEDFNAYVEKLRTIYNQHMILELMSYETNRHKFLTSGVVIDGSHNLLEPWNESTMSLTGSQYIVKCNNNKLQKFTSSSADVGTDVSLSSLNGLSFPSGSCNPCDSLLEPDNTDRYKCKYDLNMQKSVGLSGNGIWNKIWNSLTSSSATSNATVYPETTTTTA
jgi:hypothetical protein